MKSDIPKDRRTGDPRRRRRGQAIVEFALVLILLFPIFLVAIEGGISLVIGHSLAVAARESCRHLTSYRTPSGERTVAAAQAMARKILEERFGTNSPITQNFQISVTPSLADPPGVAAKARVTVTVTYALPNSWFINGGSRNLTLRGVGVFEMQGR